MKHFEPLLNEITSTPWNHSDDIIQYTNGITLLDGQVLYAVTRAYRPEVVIEAGTNTGNSSWFIGQALLKNASEGFVGDLYTVDIGDFGSRAKELASVHHIVDPRGVIHWLKSRMGKSLLKRCAFYNNDDEHRTDYTLEELALVMKAEPKVIAIHDTLAESREVWERYEKDPSLRPGYHLHHFPGVVGTGLLLRD